MTKSRSRKPRKRGPYTSKKLLPVTATYRWFNGSLWSNRLKAVLTTDTKSGVYNPHWEVLARSGVDAGSAYDRVIHLKVVNNPVVNWTWTQWKNSLKREFFVYQVQGNFPLHQMRQDFSFDAPDVSVLASRAKIAFLGKINEHQSPFKALPFLGELRETIGMLRHPLKGFARHTRRLASTIRKNQARLKAAGHISDLLTDMYLEWTYGVSPLISDIKAGYEAYRRLLVEKPVDYPLYVSAKDTYTGSDGMTIAPYTTVPVYIYNTRSSEAKVSIKGALKYDVSPPGDRLPDLVGFNLQEFVPTLWELLPYSFVIDYVSNVGDVIGGACTSTAGLRWYWQSTKIIRRRVNYYVPMPTPSLARTWPLDLQTCAVESRTFNRTKPSLSVSLRDFEFQLPTLHQEVSMVLLALSRVRSAITRR